MLSGGYPLTLKRKKVKKLAEKLVRCALDGEGWAFNMIADRLEGKAAQQIDHSVSDNREISEYSDAELTAMLRRRVGVVSVESDEILPRNTSMLRLAARAQGTMTTSRDMDAVHVTVLFPDRNSTSHAGQYEQRDSASVLTSQYAHTPLPSGEDLQGNLSTE